PTPTPSPTGSPTSEQVSDADALAAAGAHADAEAGQGNVGDPVHPCTKATDWIEIQLQDENGQPITRQDYVWTLPDGSEVAGKLDSNGFVRIEPIPPGTCSVNFPNIDSDAWQYVSSQGPRTSQN